MDDTAMNAAKAMIRNGALQMDAAHALRLKRHAKKQGTTQADFDELSRYVYMFHQERLATYKLTPTKGLSETTQ
jgi:hypothetical protein